MNQDVQMETRILEIDATRADLSERTAPCVVSTEYPVERNGYVEILSHAPNAVDLARSPLPLIESHDTGKLNIGVVEGLRVLGKKLRGTIRMGSSRRALEVWADIEAGIVSNLSIGYDWIDYDESGGEVTVTRWRPAEVSLVGVPADPNAGLYRSKSLRGNYAMKEPIDDGDERLSRSQRRAKKFEDESEAERIKILLKYGDMHASAGGRELARRLIDNGGSYDDFADEILRLHEWKARQPDEVVRAVPKVLCAGYGQREYSLQRLIQSFMPKSKVDAGYELEVSQELEHQRGRKANGVLMPLQTREVTYAGTGANLVETQHLANEFIDILRNKSVIIPRARSIVGLQGNVSIPRKDAGSTAYWIAGDGADSLTESTPSFGQIQMTPKTVGGLTQYSHRMMLQSDPGIELLLREDLASMLAVDVRFP